MEETVVVRRGNERIAERRWEAERQKERRKRRKKRYRATECRDTCRVEMRRASSGADRVGGDELSEGGKA